jgi:hypothetical protein
LGAEEEETRVAVTTALELLLLTAMGMNGRDDRRLLTGTR